MTHITSAPQASATARDERTRSLRWGLPAAIAAAAVSIYSVYGDGTLAGTQQTHQEAMLPWMIAFIVVLSGLLFGLAVPRLLRSRSLPSWGLALGIIGIATVPFFWSGLPVVFGAAALLAGRTGQRLARARGSTARLAVAATVTGLLALAGTLTVMAV